MRAVAEELAANTQGPTPSLTFGLRMAGEQSLLCGIGHYSVIVGKVAARAALAHRSLDGEVWRGLG